MPSELEDFLRRAAERRSAQARPAPAGPAKPATPPSKAPPPRQPVRTIAPEIVEAQVLPEAAVIPAVSGDDVALHVEQHLNVSEFALRTSQLGAKTGLADDVMQAHLHQAFDHHLGNLGGKVEAATLGISPATPAERAQSGGPSPLQELLAMLRSPAGVRNAILLNEILTPPHHRW